MTTARSKHTATLLLSGKVLVAGGVDASGTALASAELFTPDTTAPTLTLPSTITVGATSPLGATVTYAVSATDPDNLAGELTIVCSPASGSTFPIGTTTVNCTASDPAGNSTSGSFSVVVKGAAAQVTDLINLVNSFHLSSSLQHALDVKLSAALTAISAGDTATACSDLSDFIGQVRAKIGKGITQSQADQLIAVAQQVQAVLGC
jgi:HYR domain